MNDGSHLYDRDGARVIDARAMSWDEHPGVPGGRIKVLSQDARGHATVMLNWLPPVLAPHAPERHYHRAVVEHGYVLDGELPIREYDDAEDESGALVPFRAGYFYRRLPGSVHGVDPARVVGGTGFEILEWRSGPGTYLWEEGAERETVSMPLPEGAPQSTAAAVGDEAGVVRDRGLVTILDTRHVRWGPHPGIAGARAQVLAADAAGSPLALLAWIPPAVTGGAELHRHRTVTEFGYVLAGRLALRLDGAGDDGGSTVLLHAQCLYEHRPGAAHALETVGDANDPGCLLLEWRTGPGTYAGEAGEETERLR